MTSRELYEYQSKYLQILEELFNRIVGKDASSFTSFDEALAESRINVDRLEESSNPYTDLFDNLASLYSQTGMKVYKYAKEINYCKLVLGGSSRFYGSHLNATKSSLLFADTVLIPDPILPYLEKARKEEKFFYVHILKAIFFILQLKSLNQISFNTIPFIIFPSWEKSLETYDNHTQQQTQQLMTDVFSYYVDSGIQSLEDIFEFSEKYRESFFKRVEEAQLFVAPGRKPGDSIETSLAVYKQETSTFRSEGWGEKHLVLPENTLVINAIAERLVPQYHLIENANELQSQPLLCIDSQAHYFQLISAMKNSFITELSNSDNQTHAIVKGLTNPRMDFLANIPYDQMVAIRKSDENILFRKELRSLVNSLPSSKIEDLDVVSGEVCSYIEALISKHRKEVESIQGKYQASHQHTLLVGSVTLTSMMIPMLAPITGLGLVATGGKYIKDKLQERAELKKSSNSLMGVISLAKGE